MRSFWQVERGGKFSSRAGTDRLKSNFSELPAACEGAVCRSNGRSRAAPVRLIGLYWLCLHRKLLCARLQDTLRKTD